MSSIDAGKVAILLATKDGETYLDEQLQSLADQTYPAIDVWVSDDGSSDRTLAILAKWTERWRKGAFVVLDGPHAGFAENFRSLIINGEIEEAYVAFCDQDDIWLPEKLEIAVAWMQQQARGLPLLFCSKTETVSESGLRIGESPLFSRPPSFRNAVVQSLAGGNTMVLNRAAHRILADASRKTSFVSHDWWAYMMVTGVGGMVRYSSAPLVRYRQHAANLVGANTSWRARFSRLRGLSAGQFAGWLDTNLAALEKNRDILTPDARGSLDLLQASRSGSLRKRLINFRRSGVYRQTVAGNALLLGAVVLGWV